MTDQHGDARPASSESLDGAIAPAEPTLAEDLLLLLFQPDSGLRSGAGTIAGEGTLFYVLAGAVLADLGLTGHVRVGTGRSGFTTVEAVAENPPADRLLRASWECVAEKPRGVQTVLAATGPTLRQPVLDRLIERGDLRRSARKAFGLFRTSVIEEGDSGRRADLLGAVRAVLVDGAAPTPRGARRAPLRQRHPASVRP